MAQVSTQKARKEYCCNKCQQTIKVGDMYHKIIAQFQAPRYRCLNCKPERSELTTSDYLSWLYDLQDHVGERYDLRTEEGKDELYSELEIQRDELQSRLDNMPEQLQYAPTGEMLQERIDSIESALSDLDNLDFPDKEDYVVDESELEFEEDKESKQEELDSEYEDELDNFEQGCLDAINNIE